MGFHRVCGGAGLGVTASGVAAATRLMLFPFFDSSCPMLNTAVKAAREAAEIIQYGARNLDRLTVDSKGPGDFVSEIDRNAEAAIVDTLLGAYPSHGIIAEEGNRFDPRGNANSDHIWIIDPLDGTTNFLHGMPTYCVSIALQVEGKLTQGGDLRPQPQRPVHRHSRLWRVPEQPPHPGFQDHQDARRPDRHRVPRSVMVPRSTSTSPSSKPDAEDRRLRRPGSAALDLAYVAAGFYDGFWEMKLNQWDMAAGRC